MWVDSSGFALRGNRNDLAALCLPNLLVFEPGNLALPMFQSINHNHKIKTPTYSVGVFILVGVGGFEPPQS